MTSQEIMDFMLGKKNGGATNKGCSPARGAPTTVPHGSPRAAVGAGVVPRSPNNKKVQSVAVSFAKTLVQDWLDTDDTLHQVMQSIANLRERLWHTSQMLSALQEETSISTNYWKACGYRGGTGGGGTTRSDADNGGGLNVDDLQLALDHDLRQHERMMATLRRSLSSLNQAQEALGRRLDEYYRLQQTMSIEGRAVSSKLSLEESQGLFTATSSELYRKQVLAEKVLNSFHDGLLFCRDRRPDDDRETAGSSNPRRVAHRCSELWSRQHKKSHLLEYKVSLEKLQQRIAG